MYGHPAIAAALSDLRIVVCLTPHDKNEIRVVLPDLPTPVDYRIACETLVDDLPFTTCPVPPQPTTTAADIADKLSVSFFWIERVATHRRHAHFVLDENHFIDRQES